MYFDVGSHVTIFGHFCLITATNCYVTSVNSEFGTTLARRLNQSRVCAVLPSSLIAIKFGTVEARRLNWFSILFYYSKNFQRNAFCSEKTCGCVALCKISDESWQPTFIAEYLLCTDDG